MKRSAAAVAVALALCIVPASALANSTTQQYSPTVHSVQGKTASRTPTPKSTTATPSTVQSANATRSASTGTLPFTGLDLGGLAAGAVVLLGAGMLLRRASTSRRDS